MKRSEFSAELTIVEHLQRDATTSPTDRALLFVLCHPRRTAALEALHETIRAAISETRFTRSSAKDVRKLMIDPVLGRIPNCAHRLFASGGASAAFCEHMLEKDASTLWNSSTSEQKTLFMVMMESAPREIRSNLLLMEQAVKTNPAALRHAAPMLQTERVLVARALRHGFDSLAHVSHDAQMRHPDLVQQLAVEGFVASIDWDSLDYDENAVFTQQESLVQLLSPEYFQNRANVLKWTKAGLPWPPTDPFMGMFENDKEIYLNVAMHCRHLVPKMVAFTLGPSGALLSDKDFMSEIIKKDGRLLLQAKGDLWKDFDLMLLAFSHEKTFFYGKMPYTSTQYFWINSSKNYTQRPYIKDFYRKTVEMLDQRDYFCEHFLPALSGVSGSDAAMLNLGPETTQSHLMCLADCLGMPIGEKLRRLRRAERVLCESIGTVFKDDSNIGSWAPTKTK